MPRRTPIELVAEEAGVSNSPVRRSSRVAARRSSSETATTPTVARQTRTRRASQDESMVEYKPATRTRRANSLLDEEEKGDDGKKLNARQLTGKESVNKPITRRRASSETNDDVKPAATRRLRKNSADSVEEEPTRRVTRGRRPSTEKDDEEVNKMSVKTTTTRRRLSVTDSITKMEAIVEQTKEESPKKNDKEQEQKLSVLQEEEDEQPKKKSPKLDRSQDVNNISTNSFSLNLNDSKTSSNNSDKENSPIKQQQKEEIVDVFKPKMKEISFVVEPMEVDVTINQTKIDLNESQMSPNKSRLSLRKSLDKNLTVHLDKMMNESESEIDTLNLQLDDDDEENQIQIGNVITVKDDDKNVRNVENKETKLLQVELIDMVYEEKTDSDTEELKTLQVNVVNEVYEDKSTSKNIVESETKQKSSKGLFSTDDDDDENLLNVDTSLEAKKSDHCSPENTSTVIRKVNEEKLCSETRSPVKKRLSISPVIGNRSENRISKSPVSISQENEVVKQSSDLNMSHKMASNDSLTEKTDSSNQNRHQSPKDGVGSKDFTSANVIVEEICENTITTRLSLKKRLSASPISKRDDKNGVSEDELLTSSSKKRVSIRANDDLGEEETCKDAAKEEVNSNVDKSPTSKKIRTSDVDVEEKNIVTRSSSKQRYSDGRMSKSGGDDEESAEDNDPSNNEEKTIKSRFSLNKTESSNSSKINESIEERQEENEKNTSINKQSSLKKRFSSSSNKESVTDKSTKSIFSPNENVSKESSSSSRNDDIEESSNDRNKKLTGSSFEEKIEDDDVFENELVTKRTSTGSTTVTTRSSLRKSLSGSFNEEKTEDDEETSNDVENGSLLSETAKTRSSLKKSSSDGSFKEQIEDDNNSSEDEETENHIKRTSTALEAVKTRSSLKKRFSDSSNSLTDKKRSSLNKNISFNSPSKIEDIELQSDDGKVAEASNNEEAKNAGKANSSGSKTVSPNRSTTFEVKTRSSLDKNEIKISTGNDEDKQKNSFSSRIQEENPSKIRSEDNSPKKCISIQDRSSTPYRKKVVDEKSTKKPILVNIDPEASVKLDKLLERLIMSDDEELTEEEEKNSFVDDMVEEGEEDTPSEDSNEIIDEGESIHSTDTEERQHDDEDYEEDSFICDDEVVELLSGEEYDLSQEKKEKLTENVVEETENKKSGRIAQWPVDEMDEQEEVIVINDEKNESKIKILENITINSPNKEEMHNESLVKRLSSSSNRRRTSSITILESLKVEDLKDSDIGERISDIVESFCNNKHNGEILMNVSLEYAENSSNSSNESDSKKEKNHKRRSNDSEESEESPPVKKHRKSIQGEKSRRHSVSFDGDISENRISLTERRLSRSVEKIPLAKPKSKKRQKQMNDLRCETFNIFDQLINEEKKNRPVRKVLPTTNLDLSYGWQIEQGVSVKPSTSSITKAEKEIFNKVEKKIHPKDFRNQMLYGKKRVARIDTKKLLNKKGAF